MKGTSLRAAMVYHLTQTLLPYNDPRNRFPHSLQKGDNEDLCFEMSAWDTLQVPFRHAEGPVDAISFLFVYRDLHPQVVRGSKQRRSLAQRFKGLAFRVEGLELVIYVCLGLRV